MGKKQKRATTESAASFQTVTLRYDIARADLQDHATAKLNPTLRQEIETLLRDACEASESDLDDIRELKVHATFLTAPETYWGIFATLLNQNLLKLLNGNESKREFNRRQKFRVALHRIVGDNQTPSSPDMSADSPETIGHAATDTIRSGQTPPDWTAEANHYTAAFTAATEPLVPQFEAWLASLEGTKFPVETAEAQITAIQRAVRRAGRELVCGEHVVALYAVRQPRAKHARIFVSTVKQRPQETLSASVTLPRLSSRPAE